MQKIITTTKALAAILIFILFGAKTVNACTINVSTIAALQSAINTAASCDVIILANGTYMNNTINVGRSNIVVQAATPGGVYLNGTNAITISGNYDTFSGFQFICGTITGSVITLSGNYNTLTQLNFNGYNAGHMVYISGSQNVLSNSNFQK